MSGSRDSELSDADLHVLVRLSGEIVELRGNMKAAREHCLTTLAKLCDADKGVIAEFAPLPNGGSWEAVAPSVQYIHTPDQERRVLARFYDLNQPPDPMIEHMSRSASDILVGRPGDFLNDRVWRDSPHYNLIRRPAGVTEQIYARYRLAGVSCGIGLHRRESRPFQRREVRLVDIFMRGAGHLLHRAGEPTAMVAQADLSHTLAPRLAAVLNRFIKGETEKEAASQLGITHHTVHSYAKQIYRQLGVKSRSELLARFIKSPRRLDSD